MKIFITCVVIASLALVVFAVDWPGRAAPNSQQSRPQNASAPMAKEDFDSAEQREKAEGETEQVDDGSRRVGRITAPAPGVSNPEAEQLDSLPLYDLLLSLHFSGEGEVVIDRNTRAILQEMYAQVGAAADEQRMESLRALLAGALPEAAVKQLLDLLQNYSAYRQAALDLERTNTDVNASGEANPLENYDQLKALRRSYLGDEAASGMFSEEETQLPYMVEAMAVARDTSLSEEERTQKLAALQDGFNEAASRMHSPLAEKVLAAKVARLRAEGASEAEIFAVRSDVLGSAEAQRLADEDLANPPSD